MMELKRAIDKHRIQIVKVIRTAIFTINDKMVNIDKWAGEVLDIFDSLKKNHKSIFFIGNGASCSMASHFATDYTKNGGICSYSCNEGTLLTCFSNDFSYETAYLEIVKRYMSEGDALVAISSSGKSKNILNTVDFVNNNYSKNPVITLSGFSKDNPLRQKGTYNLFLEIEDYGFIESAHAYYLHLLIDLFIQKQQKKGRANPSEHINFI